VRQSQGQACALQHSLPLALFPDCESLALLLGERGQGRLNPRQLHIPPARQAVARVPRPSPTIVRAVLKAPEQTRVRSITLNQALNTDLGHGWSSNFFFKVCGLSLTKAFKQSFDCILHRFHLSSSSPLT